MDVNVIGDTSPLIFFAKLDELTLLSEVIGPVTAPPAVIQEAVIAGRQRQKPDARRIQQAILDHIIIPIHLTEQEKTFAQNLYHNTSLGTGECEVIACAAQRHYKALLHDNKARNMATRHGVKTINTTDVLFFALLRRQITLQTFKDLLHSLAIITGLSAATLLEQEAIADEIARQLQIEE